MVFGDYNARAGETCELHNQLTDHSTTENGYDFTNVRLSVENAIERNDADSRKHAEQGVKVFDSAQFGDCSRNNGVTPVTPRSINDVADRNVLYACCDLYDSADLRIAGSRDLVRDLVV